MIRIYADFNCQDEQGRIRLNTVGSLKDLATHKNELHEGAKVILYMPDDVEVEGVLVFDEIWFGIPDYNTIPGSTPTDPSA
jgi:hypothetical protein